MHATSEFALWNATFEKDDIRNKENIVIMRIMWNTFLFIF